MYTMYVPVKGRILPGRIARAVPRQCIRTTNTTTTTALCAAVLDTHYHTSRRIVYPAAAACVVCILRGHTSEVAGRNQRQGKGSGHEVLVEVLVHHLDYLFI